MDDHQFQKVFNLGADFLPLDQDNNPAVIDGHQIGVTSAHRNERVVRDYLERGYGLGMAGGRVNGSDLWRCYLDVDNKTGQHEGQATLDKLQVKFGPLPNTLTVGTRNNGEHKYFFSTVPLTSKTIFGQDSGIQLKCVNGYVASPLNPGYKITQDQPIATFDNVWTQALLEEASLVAQPKGVEYFHWIADPDEAKIITAFNKQVPVRTALEMAGYTPTAPDFYCHPDGAHTDKGVHILKNDSYLKHGAKELSYHFSQNDLVQQGPYDAFGIMRIRRFDGDKAEAIKFVKDKFGPSLNGQPHPSQPKKGWPVVHRFFENLNRKPRKSLIWHRMRVMDVFFMAGDSGTYKTLDALDMAFAGATGIPHHGPGGSPAAPFQTLALLTEFANSQDDDDRALAWCRVRGRQFQRDERELMELIKKNVLWIDQMFPLDGDKHEEPDAFWAWLRGVAGPDFRPEFIILDHLANVFSDYGKDECDNVEGSKWTKGVMKFARQTQTAIGVIAHPPKSKESAVRGAGAFRNNSTGTYLYTRETEDGPVTISTSKAFSYGNGYKKLTVNIESVKLYWDDGEVIPEWRYGIVLNRVEDEEDMFGDNIQDDFGRPKSKFDPNRSGENPDQAEEPEQEDVRPERPARKTRYEIATFILEQLGARKAKGKVHQVPTTEIIAWCNCSHMTVREVLNALKVRGLVRETKPLKGKGSLWEIVPQKETNKSADGIDPTFATEDNA